MKENSATNFLQDFIPWLENQGEVAWMRTMDAQPPSLAPLPQDLHEKIASALRQRGISSLYTHQAAAYQKARSRRNFVVVTPTASGKTLCYNLPVMQSLLENPETRALYLFPTKALSQDQQAELNEISLGGTMPVRAYTYDGDTPASLRSIARTQGRIVITNPDMLHAGILPNHTKWISFFSHLDYVVIDEMHTYRGIFGSHVGNVIRRLKRIAAFYGSKPCFILSSATIANPQELANMLIEDEVDLIDENGAGTSEKTIIYYNPPVLDPLQGIRRSSALESEKITLKLLSMGIKTILFARSRLKVELIASYLNEHLANPFNENSHIRISPYRSGLLPSERRAIERGLRDGSIQGVVSTNALELGIDIGGLDAAVMAGYPGSTASFWQQAGRAGRRGTASIAVMVATSSPLDQFFAAHPEYFFSQKPEKGRVDLNNVYIFMDHAKCAAFELPFNDGADSNFGRAGKEDLAGALEILEAEGVVRKTEGRWFWASEGYPGESVSLRSARSDNVVIVDTTNGAHAVIGEMDRPSAKELIFDNAVYIHNGTQYMVEKLDIENRICKVVKKDVEYWTDSIVKTDLEVLTEDEHVSFEAFSLECFVGDVLIRDQVQKFKKLRFHTHENIGYGEIYLPPEEMQTRAAMFVVEPKSPAGRFLDALSPAQAQDALSGAGKLLKSLAPAFLLCDPVDIGMVARVKDPHFQKSALIFFDKYPGGTGLSEALPDRAKELFMAAEERVFACGCKDGCPSCVGADLPAIKQIARHFLALCSADGSLSGAQSDLEGGSQEKAWLR